MLQSFTSPEQAASLFLEPGLLWVSACLNTPAHTDPTTGLAPIWQFVEFTTDVMHPRFPIGTVVAVAPVLPGEPFPPGVYLWWDVDAPDLIAHVGRLVQAHGNWLELSLDNRPSGIICLLEWDKPGFRLCRATHYASFPIQ